MPGRTLRIDRGSIDILRSKLGWSLADLAAEAGCSNRTIDSVMAGNGAYRSTIQKIAGALKVSPECLCHLEPEKSPPPSVEVQLKISIPFDQFDECGPLVNLVRLLTTAVGSLAAGVGPQTAGEAGVTVVSLRLDPALVQRLAAHFVADNEVSVGGNVAWGVDRYGRRIRPEPSPDVLANPLKAVCGVRFVGGGWVRVKPAAV